MALRIKDMTKGKTYEWTYFGNKCVGTVTTVVSNTVVCKYAVGMWEDSVDIENGDRDHVAVDCNLRNYDITNIKIASTEQSIRYQRVVRAHQKEIETANEQYDKQESIALKKEHNVTAPVDADNELGVGKSIGVKVIGKIDLGDKPCAGIAGVGHPERKTKEEKKAEREMAKASMRGEWTPKQAFQEIHSPSFYHYADEEIISFSCNGRRGVAIGMVDEWHQQIGFYVAFNMFKDNGITKWGDIVDGKEVNAWPDPVTVGKPDMAQKQIGEAFLMPMYRAEIDAYHAATEKERQAWEEEQARLKAEEERLKAEEEARLKAESEAEKSAKVIQDEEEEVKLFAGIKLPHMPYCRGEETLLDMKWPIVSDCILEHQVLFGLSELAKIISSCKCNRRQDASGFRTLVLTLPYLKELRSRRDDYIAQYSSFKDLIGVGETRCGAFCYRSGSDLTSLSTIMYFIDVHNNGRETLKMALLSDENLQCTYRGTTQGMFGDSAPTITYMSDNSNVNIRKMIESAKTLLFCLLAMERDTDQLIHKYVSGDGAVHKVYENSHMGEPDIELRDSTWFTNIFINKTISVDAYKSHRWFGHGDNKELREVEVSAYTKGGYTRQAKVINNG